MTKTIEQRSRELLAETERAVTTRRIRELAALHESAHAVAALFEGFEVRELTIDDGGSGACHHSAGTRDRFGMRDPEQLRSLGLVRLAGPLYTIRAKTGQSVSIAWQQGMEWTQLREALEAEGGLGDFHDAERYAIESRRGIDDDGTIRTLQAWLPHADLLVSGAREPIVVHVAQELARNGFMAGAEFRDTVLTFLNGKGKAA
jgi:hypothetical protein